MTKFVHHHGSADREIDCDAVVLVTQRRSRTEIYRGVRELRADDPASAKRVFRIGDCLVPRIIAESVFDGHRLGREIDTDDPRVPLPYLRERRVVGAIPTKR